MWMQVTYERMASTLAGMRPVEGIERRTDCGTCTANPGAVITRDK
jgi:hypothetical protein